MEAIGAYLALSKVDLGGKLEQGQNACMHAWVDLASKVESHRKVESYRKVHPGPPSWTRSAKSAKLGGNGGKPIEIFI